MQIVIMPLEESVLLDLQEHIEIARRSTAGAGLPFSGQTQPVAVADTRRNVHLELAVGLLETFPAALLTWVADDLSGAVAVPA